MTVNAMGRWRFVLACVLGIGVAGLHGSAMACTCAPPGTTQQGMDEVDLVFMGVVEQFAVAEPPSETLVQESRLPPLPVYSGRMATVRVTTIWKGEPQPHIRVRTGFGSKDCGYEFIVGQEHLVYAFRTAGGLYTSICTRTRRRQEAGMDVALLGVGAPVTDTAVQSTP